jgi:hypothetical protein
VSREVSALQYLNATCGKSTKVLEKTAIEIGILAVGKNIKALVV